MHVLCVLPTAWGEVVGRNLLKRKLYVVQISVLFINSVSVFCHWIAGLPWRTGLGWRTGSLEGKPLLRKSLHGEDRARLQEFARVHSEQHSS